MIPIVAGAPLRFTEGSEDRLEEAQSELRAVEQKLLESSERRIHDFERRLEHEWLALRQLHEEPLKALETKTTSITETCLALVREVLVLLQSQLAKEQARSPHDESELLTLQAEARRSRAMVAGLFVTFALLAAFTAYTGWSLGNDIRDTTARAASAERRVTELQQMLERQARSTEETVQRVTSEALRAQRLANVLAASDVRVFPMRGLLTAAAATGRTHFSPSRGVTVNVTGLPVPAANQVYQVWLVTTGISISLGFVAPDAQGRVDAAFDTPSELPGTVTGFMLSLEPTSGNAKPTGPIVIAS
jgi:Anti-sigma-K factor rskA, C-terminal